MHIGANCYGVVADWGHPVADVGRPCDDWGHPVAAAMNPINDKPHPNGAFFMLNARQHHTADTINGSVIAKQFSEKFKENRGNLILEVMI